MTALNYQDIIAQSRKELSDLVDERERIDQRIAQLNKALRGLAPMLPAEKKRDLMADLSFLSRRPAGLTEAILNVLREGGEMTANEIRDELENTGFDLSEYSQPLAAIGNTLTRMKDGTPTTPKRVIRTMVKGVGLRWKAIE